MKTAMSSSCSVRSPALNQRYGLPIKGTPATVWASVGVSTISFECKRDRNEVDACMSQLYKEIINDRVAFTRMLPCSSEALIDCGNIRGVLSECACPTLNRVTNPSYRQAFEASVIDKALYIIQKGETRLNLAFFASGGLHGEDVLMIKLIDALKKLNKAVEIQIFLIDLAYTPYIDHATFMVNAGTPLVWDDLTGKLPALKQFLTEIALSTPSFIKVKGTLFASSESYIDSATRNPGERYDLLIGADIGNTLPSVPKMQMSHISKRNLPAIMLIKQIKDSQEQAKLCQIHGLSGKLDCDALDNVSLATGSSSFEEAWGETSTSFLDQISWASNQRSSDSKEEESDILQTFVCSGYPSGNQQADKEEIPNGCQIS